MIERVERLKDLQRLSVFHGPAPDMSASLHQIEIIERATGRFQERFDHGFFRIVDEHHHMRAFENRARTDFRARGDTFRNGSLRSADEAFRTLRKVVLFQIHAGDQPRTDSRKRLAFQQHKAAGNLDFQCVADVGTHPGLNLPRALRALLQINLRQDNFQRRGGISHQMFHLGPVFRIGSKLITGNHCPAVIGDMRARSSRISAVESPISVFFIAKNPYCGRISLAR